MKLRIAALGLALATGLFAQGATVSVRVFADAPGARIWVDGQLYTGPAVLLWPEGSKHTVAAIVQQNEVNLAKRYVFGGWATNIAPLTGDFTQVYGFDVASTNVITASRDITYVKASFSVQYGVDVHFYPCTETASVCAANLPGRVYVNGSQFTRDGQIWIDANSTVSLEAYPNPGYIFTGWAQMTGASQRSSSFQYSFVLTNPVVVSPMFRFARPLQVTIETEPEGLKILADRSPIVAPFSIEWGFDTVHTLGAMPVQYDAQGRLWIFQSWSDGGAINHEFTMPPGTTPVTVKAQFVPGAVVGFITAPAGLKLRIDNRENWPNYTFQWAAGTTHPVSAPLEQTDADGRKYRFQGWSDGKPASHDYTVEAAPASVSVTAVYKAVGQVAVSSAPEGVRVRVDGEECTTPCNIEREVGATVRVSAPPVQPLDDSSRLAFQGWYDVADPERSIVAADVPVKLTAVYEQQNRLSVLVEPADAAVTHVSPEAPDGYYMRDALVTVELKPTPGHRFAGWDGDATGKRLMAAVSMATPKRLHASFEAVPYIPPSGVRNAAGEIPVEGVAPGSIISIFGVNLASQPEAGPGNPLAQTIADVTVRMGDRLLPMFMVSPGEVRAQLPGDTELGGQRLTVRWEGKPDATVDFQAVRNAPGLFSANNNDRQLAIALQENGETLPSGSGVRPGDTVTLLGTGFGPCLRTPPDGFALPDAPDFRVADTVEVIFGETVLESLYAGAGGQSAGVNAVRFRIPADAPAGAEVPVKVRVNGVESNTVLLPVVSPAAAQDTQPAEQ